MQKFPLWLTNGGEEGGAEGAVAPGAVGKFDE